MKQVFINRRRIKMKKVLLVDEKYSYRVFDISTRELSEKAFLTLFQERDKTHKYNDVIEIHSSLFSRAREGDGKAAMSIIRNRSATGHKYEFILDVDVE